MLSNNRNLMIIGGVIVVIGLILWFSGAFSKDSEKKVLEKVDEEAEVLKALGGQVNAQVKDSGKIKVYNFNTSWCRYSVMFAPEWAKFETLVEKYDNIEALDIKCDDESNEGICREFDVPGFPSVVVEKNGQVVAYNGMRNAEAILSFVLEL